MVLAFPGTPSNGTIYSPGGGVPDYIYSGGEWQVNIPSVGPLTAPIDSPSFTGTPFSTLPAVDDNTGRIATTQWYMNQISTLLPIVNGIANIGTSLKFARADHIHAIDITRAPLAAPIFTGIVTIPAGASIAGFATLASPTLTGIPAAPTAAINTNSTQLATTAFVLAQSSATTPLANAVTAVIGISTRFARADHVHPSNLTNIAFNAIAANETDLSKHISLYSTTYGFNVITNGTINYVSVYNHSFISQGVHRLDVVAGVGINVNGTINGTSTINATAGLTAQSDMLYGASGANRVLQFAGSSWYLFWEGANGNLSYQTPSGTAWEFRTSDWLFFNQSGPVGGVGAFQVYSDIRSKDNINPSTYGLAEILLLNPVKFTRKLSITNIENTSEIELKPRIMREEIGFIAQELQIVIPHATVTMGIPLADGTGGIDSDDPTLGILSDVILAACVNAIKELNTKHDTAIQELTDRITILEGR